MKVMFNLFDNLIHKYRIVLKLIIDKLWQRLVLPAKAEPEQYWFSHCTPTITESKLVIYNIYTARVLSVVLVVL